MGNGFELRIGMTTQQVMSNISRMNATEKTKQMIINFCNNDQDKKISNEIERAMLNSWASGSEKVKMPTADGMKQVKGEPVGYSFMFDKNGTHGQLYRASNNRLLGIITGKNDTNITYTSHYSNNSSYRIDYLEDRNNDGYADVRNTFLASEKEDEDFHVTSTSHSDSDLDGTYDTKCVDDIKLRGYMYTQKSVTTDLHTGEIKTTYDKYDIRKSE